MEQKSVFEFISEVTRKTGSMCILIGGFAVNHYKVTRQTADVDFLITKSDFEKIFQFLEEAGYKRISTHENFVQMESSKAALMDVDFMFIDAQTMQKFIDQGEKIKIAGEEFIVPSLEHLIALKLHSIRHNPKIRLMRDFPDIVNLLRINEINVHDKKIKDLCLKFGSEELYIKIAEALR